MPIVFEPAYFPHFDFDEFAKEKQRYNDCVQNICFSRGDRKNIEHLATEHIAPTPHILGKYNEGGYAVAYCGQLYICMPNGRML